MNIIICLDDKNGMMFNKRRQSQDSVLRSRVLDMSSGSSLWMSPYSAKQFETSSANIKVDKNYQKRAQKDDFCFVEDVPCSLENADSVIIYRWNRHYPADVYFELDLIKSGYRLVRVDEFAGSSHEKITEEIYEKIK